MNRQTASYAGARIISAICVVVSLAACYPTLALARRLNTIPNSQTGYDQWARTFGIMVGIALLGVFVLAIVSLATRIKPLRVASIVSIVSCIVAIPISAVQFLIPPDIFIFLPAAFFGAAVLFSFLRAVRAVGEPRQLVATSILGTVAFLVCVYGHLFLAKLWALNWGLIDM